MSDGGLDAQPWRRAWYCLLLSDALLCLLAILVYRLAGVYRFAGWFRVQQLAEYLPMALILHGLSISMICLGLEKGLRLSVMAKLAGCCATMWAAAMLWRWQMELRFSITWFSIISSVVCLSVIWIYHSVGLRITCHRLAREQYPRFMQFSLCGALWILCGAAVASFICSRPPSQIFAVLFIAGFGFVVEIVICTFGTLEIIRGCLAKECTVDRFIIPIILPTVYIAAIWIESLRSGVDLWIVGPGDWRFQATKVSLVAVLAAAIAGIWLRRHGIALTRPVPEIDRPVFADESASGTDAR